MKGSKRLEIGKGSGMLSPFAIDQTARGVRRAKHESRQRQRQKMILRMMHTPNLDAALDLENDDWLAGLVPSSGNTRQTSEPLEGKQRQSSVLPPPGKHQSTTLGVAGERGVAASTSLMRSSKHRTATEIQAGVGYAEVTEELRIALSDRGVDDEVGMQILDLQHAAPPRLPQLPASPIARASALALGTRFGGNSGTNRISSHPARDLTESVIGVPVDPMARLRQEFRSFFAALDRTVPRLRGASGRRHARAAAGSVGTRRGATSGRVDLAASLGSLPGRDKESLLATKASCAVGASRSRRKGKSGLAEPGRKGAQTLDFGGSQRNIPQNSPIGPLRREVGLVMEAWGPNSDSDSRHSGRGKLFAKRPLPRLKQSHYIEPLEPRSALVTSEEILDAAADAAAVAGIGLEKDPTRSFPAFVVQQLRRTAGLPGPCRELAGRWLAAIMAMRRPPRVLASAGGTPGSDGALLPPAFPEMGHFSRLLQQSDDPLALSAMLAVRRAACKLLGLRLRSRRGYAEDYPGRAVPLERAFVSLRDDRLPGSVGRLYLSVEAVQVVLRSVLEAQQGLVCEAPADLVPRDRERLAQVMRERARGGDGSRDEVGASLSEPRSKPLVGCAARLVDSTCCAIVASGVLQQLDGFAVPMAESRLFFRFVYSMVAASDDDSRRSALECSGATYVAQGGEARRGGEAAGADRVLRATATSKQANEDAEEARIALRSGVKRLEDVNRRLHAIAYDESHLSSTWTGKPSDHTLRANHAAQKSRLEAQKQQLENDVERLRQALRKADRRTLQAQEAEEAAWAGVDATAGSSPGRRGPQPLPPISSGATPGAPDPRSTHLPAEQGPALQRGLAAFRLAIMRLEQRWVARKQSGDSGSTSGAPPGVLALPGKLPYPGDPLPVDVPESLADASIPWHLEPALLEYERMRTRPPSPELLVLGTERAGPGLSAAEVREQEAIQAEILQDIESFALELSDRAAAKIQMAWMARKARNQTRLEAMSDVERRKLEIAAQEAAERQRMRELDEDNLLEQMELELGNKRHMIRKFVNEMRDRRLGRMFSAWAGWAHLEARFRQGRRLRTLERLYTWRLKALQHKAARKIARDMERLWLGHLARQNFALLRRLNARKMEQAGGLLREILQRVSRRSFNAWKGYWEQRRGARDLFRRIMLRAVRRTLTEGLAKHSLACKAARHRVATGLQRRYRGRYARQLVAMHRAARGLQRLWRGRQAREVANIARRELARKHRLVKLSLNRISRRLESACLMQWRWYVRRRKHIAAVCKRALDRSMHSWLHRWRSEAMAQRAAKFAVANGLQAVFRARRAAFLTAAVRRKKNAATMIQSRWRSYAARRLASRLRRWNRAASVIQFGWRAFAATMRAAWDEHYRFAVTEIQRLFRGHLARKDVAFERIELMMRLADEKQADILLPYLYGEHGFYWATTQDREGCTMLMRAAVHGSRRIVKACLKAGAEPDAQDSRGRTVVHLLAAARPFPKQMEILEYVVSRGAATELQDLEGLSPLMLAAREGRADSCEILLRSLAKGRIVDGQRRTALHLACEQGNLSTVNVLLHEKWRLSPNARDLQANTPLHVVARRGAVPIATSLLLAGAVPNPRQFEGKSPLHVAVECGHSAMVALLVHSGADTALADRIGNTALHYAALYAGLPPKKQSESQQDQQNGEGDQQGLQQETSAGYEEAVEDAATGGGGSEGRLEPATSQEPSEVAAEMLATLVEGDADVRIQNSAGDTALHMACRMGIAPAVTALLDNAAVPNDTNFKGETALHACAAKDAADCAELLLQHELDANIKNFDGRTALGEARMCGAHRLEALLREEFVEVVVAPSGGVVAVQEAASSLPSGSQTLNSVQERSIAQLDGRSARSRSSQVSKRRDEVEETRPAALALTSGQPSVSTSISLVSSRKLQPPTPAHEFRGIGGRLSYAPDAASSLRRDFGSSSVNVGRGGGAGSGSGELSIDPSAGIVQGGMPSSPGFDDQLSIVEDDLGSLREARSPSSTFGGNGQKVVSHRGADWTADRQSRFPDRSLGNPHSVQLGSLDTGSLPRLQVGLRSPANGVDALVPRPLATDGARHLSGGTSFDAGPTWVETVRLLDGRTVWKHRLSGEETETRPDELGGGWAPFVDTVRGRVRFRHAISGETSDEDPLAVARLGRKELRRRRNPAKAEVDDATVEDYRRDKQREQALLEVQIQRSQAARSMQRAFRRSRARRAMKRVREMSAASVTVQCAYRCHLARAALALRRREREAATNLQRLWRGKTGRLAWYVEHQRQTQQWAAWTIQRTYLGHRARYFVRWLLATAKHQPSGAEDKRAFFVSLASSEGVLLRRRNGWSEYAYVGRSPSGRLLAGTHMAGERAKPALRARPRFYVPDASARREAVLSADLRPWEVVQDWPLHCRTKLPTGDYDTDSEAKLLRPHTRNGWWRPLPSACLAPCDLPTCQKSPATRQGKTSWVMHGRAILDSARRLAGHSWSSDEQAGQQPASSSLPLQAGHYAAQEQEAGWNQPMDWAMADRRESRQMDEQRVLRHVREQDYASSHVALSYRSARIRKAVLRCVKAKRVMRGAEDAYLENPTDIAARVNYALYQQAIKRDVVRARQLYVGLLDWMTRRGPDEPVILFGFALLLLVTQEEPFDVIEVMVERAKSAEQVLRGKPGQRTVSRNLSVFAMAELGFFRHAFDQDKGDQTALMAWGALLSALKGEHWEAEQVLLDAIDVEPRNLKAVNLLSYVLQQAGKEYDGFEAYLKRQERRAIDDSAAALKAFEEVRRSGIAREFARIWRGYRVRDAVRRLVHTVEEEGLPQDWDKLYTEDGQEYFYNPRTKATTWVLPSVWGYWDKLRMMGVVSGNGTVTGGGFECAGLWRGRDPRPPPGGGFNSRREFQLARLRFEDEDNESSEAAGSSADGEGDEGAFDGPASGAGDDRGAAATAPTPAQQQSAYSQEPPTYEGQQAEQDPRLWELVHDDSQSKEVGQTGIQDEGEPSQQGKAYYYCASTGESRWTMPRWTTDAKQLLQLGVMTRRHAARHKFSPVFTGSGRIQTYARMALGGTGGILGAGKTLAEEERAARLRRAEATRKEEEEGTSRAAAQARERRLRALRQEKKAMFAAGTKAKARMDADLQAVLGGGAAGGEQKHKRRAGGQHRGDDGSGGAVRTDRLVLATERDSGRVNGGLVRAGAAGGGSGNSSGMPTDWELVQGRGGEQVFMDRRTGQWSKEAPAGHVLPGKFKGQQGSFCHQQ